jgi:putative hemolysin
MNMNDSSVPPTDLSESTAPPLVELKDAAMHPLIRPLWSVLQRPIRRCLALDDVNQTYSHYYDKLAGCKAPGEAFRQCLETLNVTYRVSPGDLEKIPSKGPLVVVANHPFGGLEGVVLGAVLLQVRSDLKILGNYLLRRIAGIGERILAVDPFEGPGAVKNNLGGIKAALGWVKAGGVLQTFPAGEVSSFQWRNGKIVDPAWSAHIGGIIRRSRASVLPVYFPGNNGVIFQLMGLVHPRLRTALLPRALMNKKGRTLPLYIGRPIPWRKLQHLDSDRAVIEFLRLCTYFLKNRGKDTEKRLQLLPLPPKPPKAKMPVIDPIPGNLLRSELHNLPGDQQLVRNGDFEVYIARAHQIPRMLQEIGRLREITFREVEEGTGKAVDLDRFDDDYDHLFLWNRAAAELVGAYRLGPTDRILAEHGPKGLYTNQLFRFKPEFVRRLSHAIEFGRSFIRPEYQKKFNSLMLLWKGIGEFVSRYPQYHVLFGPVSISKDYQSVSRNLMVRFLKARKFDDSLSRLVSPRRPYRTSMVESISKHVLRMSFQDIDDISLLISEIEKDGKGIPILLRHYLKLNGNLVCFNVDREFSDVVDGLLMVDLLRTDVKLLRRFMGETGFDRFSRYHPGLESAENRSARKKKSAASSGANGSDEAAA